MKYLQKVFSVGLTGNKNYERNYDRVFRKRLFVRIKELLESLLTKIFWG